MIKPIAKRSLLTWEWLESGVVFDLTSKDVLANPYPTYQRLRERDPVHRMRLVDAWVLTRYEDVQAVLQDHRRFSNQEAGAGDREYTKDRSMLDLDPPDHTRLRSLVSKAFTPRSVAALAPRIERIVEELLDEVDGEDRFDLIDSFAFPLPIIVIAEMLGVPAEDLDRFKDWSNDIVLSLEPILSREQRERFRRSEQELYEYFEGIIALRRQEPQDDLVSALLAAEEEGDRLSHGELLATLLLLLVAGNETTRNLIGNGMLALLRNPGELQRLREQRDLLDPAIDELLRYDSPVQLDGRTALEDVELGSKLIRTGQQVVSVVGAANRDPAAFSDPDRLDIGRQEKSHISFGRGIHYCLGASLATLEGRIAFEGLLERFSTVRLAAEPQQRKQVVLRGVENLVVDVERPSRFVSAGMGPLATVRSEASNS
ncbi:MAG: cytochrome P450 [Caldilineaceae bacterium SB0661_bin_32]|uniref:Cytochrome P450 n=1 Tax=Caldilineaceae bacterium SB0661_bin_32 TaxID=2605255 RepID=A0A6B1D6N2_9CHLR|nr:cytochrome P450 [Caldilineaceae bacterium SB0661_bin_32]